MAKLGSRCRGRPVALYTGTELVGRYREQLVALALLGLRKDGYISSFTVSVPNGVRDRSGIDATFCRIHGQAPIAFQIKGSEAGVNKHFSRHPDIPCINVGDCSTKGQVRKILIRAFRLQKGKKADGRFSSNEKDNFCVVLVPINNGEGKGCINNVVQKYRCKQHPVLYVKGLPHVQCCNRRECRQKAREIALMFHRDRAMNRSKS